VTSASRRTYAVHSVVIFVTAYISAVETGQQRVAVVEFLDFADALGFDPRSAIRSIHAKPAR
jgi:hypothetical protein